MVIRCFVCKNNQETKRTSRNDLSFHGFPKNKDLKKQWLDFFKLTEDEVFVSSRVCSDHFVENDFIDNRQGGGLRVLKQGSRPSIRKRKKHISSIIPVAHKSVATSYIAVKSPITTNYCLPATRIKRTLKENVSVSNENEALVDEKKAIRNVITFDEPQSGSITDLALIENPNLSTTRTFGELQNCSLTDKSDTIIIENQNLNMISVTTFDEVQSGSITDKALVENPDVNTKILSTPTKKNPGGFRYIGDLGPRDWATPRRAKKCFQFVRSIIEKQRKIIKAEKEKNRRLIKKIKTLKMLAQSLQRKNLLTEEAASNFFKR